MRLDRSAKRLDIRENNEGLINLIINLIVIGSEPWVNSNRTVNRSLINRLKEI